METEASAPNARHNASLGFSGAPITTTRPAPHFQRRGYHEHADRPRALDDDSIAEAKTAGGYGAVEGANATGQGFGERPQDQRHVVG